MAKTAVFFRVLPTFRPGRTFLLTARAPAVIARPAAARTPRVCRDRGAFLRIQSLQVFAAAAGPKWMRFVQARYPALGFVSATAVGNRKGSLRRSLDFCPSRSSQALIRSLRGNCMGFDASRFSRS